MTSPSVQLAAEALPLATRLPVRQEDPISLLFMIKVLLITALLLGITYLGLRWYAQRSNSPANRHLSADLSCVATLRLSARTKVYMVKTATANVLISETQTGTTVTVLPPGTTQDETALQDGQTPQ